VSGTVYLAYLNGYSPPWAEALEQGLAETLSCPVRRLEVGLDLGQAFAADRRQYHATLILARLLRHLPDRSSKIVGVTAVDLFIPVLSFVFGQAQLGGPGAVVSTQRLQTEYYGLPPDEGLLLERTIKEAVHELGHAFGLVHCPDYRCVMHPSTHVEEVDLKGAEYCRDCRATVDQSGA
jgi:archaemetzincin